MKDKSYYRNRINEIDKEINEKEMLIDKKFLIYAKGKRKSSSKPKQVPQKPFVKKYLLEEIERLKQRKLYYENEIAELDKYKKIYIAWDWVTFGDGFIDVTYPGFSGIVFRIDVANSKKSFGFIQKRFELLLPPFKVKVWVKLNEMKLADKVTFDSVIRYLAIRKKMHDISSGQVLDFNSFRHFVPDKINDLFFTAQKSIYMNYLCLNQAEGYKVIPIEEKKKVNNQILYEDSFLFAIRKADRILIVWENVNDKRATYVFPATTANYESLIETIYGYIITPAKHKRLMMHRKTELDYFQTTYYIINHQEYSTWEQKLNKYLNTEND